MNNNLPERIDLNFLKGLDAALTVNNLDDLFEVILSRLLQTPHVRQAVIYLFNSQDKLVSVANAKNLNHKGNATQDHDSKLDHCFDDQTFYPASESAQHFLYLLSSIYQYRHWKDAGFFKRPIGSNSQA